MFLLLNKKELISIYWQIVTCLSPIPYASPLTSNNLCFFDTFIYPFNSRWDRVNSLRIHIQHCSETEKSFKCSECRRLVMGGKRKKFYFLLFWESLNKSEMVPISGNPHKSSWERIVSNVTAYQWISFHQPPSLFLSEKLYFPLLVESSISKAT